MSGPVMETVLDGVVDNKAWADARRILCIRLDSLGGVLMTTPALRALKATHPMRRLTLLCSPDDSRAARSIPEVDEVIQYSAPWTSNALAFSADADASEDRRVAALLRNGEFDAAVIFTVYNESPLPAAMLCRLAGIPLVLAHCRENPHALLSDWQSETEPQAQLRHEVQRQLDLVAAIGATGGDRGLSFRVDAEARLAAGERLTAAGIEPEASWVLIHPGAAALSHRYPAAAFAAAADLIAARSEGPLVFNGTVDEVELIEEIRAAMTGPSVSLAGQLDLAQTAAVIEAAQVLLSVNNDAVHLAAAVGTPVADLYALTSPQQTPWSVPHRVLYHDVACRYCNASVCPQGHHDCLRMIAPQTVADAVLELCDQFPREPPLRIVRTVQIGIPVDAGAAPNAVRVSEAA